MRMRNLVFAYSGNQKDLMIIEAKLRSRIGRADGRCLDGLSGAMNWKTC
jgi:hypothetical protein